MRLLIVLLALALATTSVVGRRDRHDEKHGRHHGFKPKRFDFCKNKTEIGMPDETSGLEGEEGHDPMDESLIHGNSTKHKRAKRGLKILKAASFYCVADLRDVCGFEKIPENTCPEVALDQCGSCFSNDTVKLDRECLCDCEEANPVVESACNITERRELRRDADDDDDDDDKHDRKHKKKHGRRKHKMVKKVLECFRSDWDSLSDTCTNAITSVSKGGETMTDEESPELVFALMEEYAEYVEEVNGEDRHHFPYAAVIGGSVGLLALVGVGVILKKRRDSRQTNVEPTHGKALAVGGAPTAKVIVIDPANDSGVPVTKL